jgi:hypothetical protein
MTIRGPFAVGLLLFLFVSLAANFLVAGFVVARVGAAPPAADVERVLASATRSFPPEIQRAIADTTKANRPQLRTRLEAVQKARQDMFDAMRAQPFNQPVLEKAFADYRISTAALQKASEDVMTQAIAQAPPDVRRKIKPPPPMPQTQPAQPRLPQT